MFETLTDKLGAVFNKITSRGVLSEADIDSAMREIRVALLEADVSLSVVKDFIAHVKEQALGEKVVRSVQPGQMVVKIVHDELVKLLGSDETEINLNAPAPAVVLMVGLQGSGKTTTTAKIANKLKKNKKVLMASLDVYRPAAREQLAQLGKQVGVDCLEIVEGETPIEITERALKTAKTGVYDVLFLDTAGRLQIDEELMGEVSDVKKLSNPIETLLVCDALIGQEACNVAKAFNEKIGVTGLVLTRVDGSSRAGAALSMKMVTGVPIKYLGTGEKTDEIEAFHADRIAGRILGQGDVVTLVEKAMENIDRAQAEKEALQMMKGKFDLNDLLSQMRQMKKLGSMGSILSMIPGISKYKAHLEQINGDEIIKKQEAIILSMTKAERSNPDIIKASRKKRIASGSGVEVTDVNKLLKSYEQMASMMKQMGKFGSMKGLAQMVKRSGMGGFPFNPMNNKRF
ncbi:MAG: signal recognition particle protein [Alphaproteobacteria bacterium]|nr:signal recognition particle protein [Alphaproteobacteria bacterium]